MDSCGFLTDFTDEELAALIDRANAIIETRRREVVDGFDFEFEATNDPRKGMPYVARLVWTDGKMERKFFNLNKSCGKKSVTVSGRYTAKPGDIIEIREGGSWKNDYRAWHLVESDGSMRQVSHVQDSQRKMAVEKYLRGELTADQI